MKIQTITTENNLIQRLIALRHNRHKRYHYREFIIEGCYALDAALAEQWPIKSLYFQQQSNLSQWAKRYINQCGCEHIYEISPEIMSKAADKNDLPEIIAVGNTQQKTFSYCQAAKRELFLVLDQPKSANNIGTVIRSAVAFNVTAIIISGHAADVYDPKCIRASVGTFFKIPIYYVSGINEFKEAIAKFDVQPTIITTGDKGGQELMHFTFPTKLTFLILGNETQGVSSGYRDLAQHFVRITTTDAYTSLNIASAASILLHECYKQRFFTSGFIK